MVYAPDPSGDAMGRLFPYICAANSSADREDGGLAGVRRLGATPSQGKKRQDFNSGSALRADSCIQVPTIYLAEVQP
jgi:hypothetical protein